MYDIHMQAKAEAKYNATIFYKMIKDQGGLLTAKALIDAPKPSDGYTALYERECPKLTVEAVVLENSEWHELFTPEELAKAKKRLLQYNYIPTSFH